MMRTRIEHAPELLDAPSHDPAELEQSLDQVAEVNRLLGGRRAVLLALDELAPASGSWHILDVGTGSADIPIAIDDWARRRALDVRITAADSHPQMRELAARRTRARPAITIAAANAVRLPWAAGSFDVVLLSLTLHHFEHDDQLLVLREAARVARQAIVVNELERCRANYVGARLLALTRWRGNRLTRHDGPLSVLRAFTPGELSDSAAAAGLRVLSLRRRFLFRIVMIAAAA